MTDDQQFNQQDQNPVDNAGQAPGQEKKAGPVIGIVIIVVVLVLGALYFWGQQIDQNNEGLSPEEIMVQPDDSLKMLGTQEISDDIDSIENDLNNTDTSGLDAELSNIEAELGL